MTLNGSYYYYFYYWGRELSPRNRNRYYGIKRRYQFTSVTPEGALLLRQGDRDVPQALLQNCC